MTLKSHYLIAALALVVIFVAGTGFAFILSSARDHDHGADPPKLETVPANTWVDQTLNRLAGSLDLRPDQVEAIRGDVVNAGLDVANVRERAMLEYHLLLLRIHQDITPKLDPEQQEKLEKSREMLQHTIEHRFPSMETPSLADPLANP